MFVGALLCRSSTSARCSCCRRTASPRRGPGRPATSSPSAASRASEWKRSCGAFARGDREVGPRRVADEERVAGEHELLVDDERAVLRPVARRVQRRGPEPRRPARPVAVRERLERVRRARRARGSRPARRARARGGRGPTGGRRACASRARARSARRLSRAASRYCSIANAGSTTTATPASASPTRYERTAEIVVHELPEEQHGRASLSRRAATHRPR